MAIRSYKLGPGVLTLDPGADFDCSTQMTNVRVEWTESTTSEDAIPVLSGEEIAAEESADYTAKLSGTALQDLELAGLVQFTWDHMGEEIPFTFQPRSDTDRAVTGTVRVAPLNLGGDVSKTARPTSDFSWSCIGLPDLGDATP